LKILLVNKYFFMRGGAEAVFFDTAELLRARGHRVIDFSMRHPRNFSSFFSKYFVSEIDFRQSGSLSRKIKAGARLLYSRRAGRQIEKLVKKEKPRLAHLHNIYHHISPSIIPVLKKHGIPVVMTLHDYKLLCPVYTLFNRGEICVRCLPGKYYWCLLKKCRNDSYGASLLNTFEMYLHHKILDVYGSVDIFISPSRFLRNTMEKCGFGNKVYYLPNFLKPEDYLPDYAGRENRIVYFGRLSPEKGLFTLLSALKGLPLRCWIIGDGPSREKLKERVEKESISNISFRETQSPEKLKKLISKSLFVVLPSEWYENSPRSVIEAFALGKPVVASRIGGIPELVKDYKTGLTFEPGNAEDLRAKLELLSRDHGLAEKMGRVARKFVEENLNPEKHYRELMKIYELARCSRNS